jgi:hypothetical protein
LYFYFFTELQYRAGQATIPQQRKALVVVRHAIGVYQTTMRWIYNKKTDNIMITKLIFPLICFLVMQLSSLNIVAQKKDSLIGAEFIDQSLYKNREILPDIYGKPDPSLEKTLVQVRGNLYRHTNGTLPALHS